MYFYAYYKRLMEIMKIILPNMVVWKSFGIYCKIKAWTILPKENAMKYIEKLHIEGLKRFREIDILFNKL